MPSGVLWPDFSQEGKMDPDVLELLNLPRPSILLLGSVYMCVLGLQGSTTDQEAAAAKPKPLGHSHPFIP